MKWDMKEHLTNKELHYRTNYRSTPNILGFSLFWKNAEKGRNHLSIVQNTNYKPYTSWTDRYNDFFAKRDAFAYIKSRWFAH